MIVCRRWLSFFGPSTPPPTLPQPLRYPITRNIWVSVTEWPPDTPCQHMSTAAKLSSHISVHIYVRFTCTRWPVRFARQSGFSPSHNTCPGRIVWQSVGPHVHVGPETISTSKLKLQVTLTFGDLEYYSVGPNELGSVWDDTLSESWGGIWARLLECVGSEGVSDQGGVDDALPNHMGHLFDESEWSTGIGPASLSQGAKVRFRTARDLAEIY